MRKKLRRHIGSITFQPINIDCQYCFYSWYIAPCAEYKRMFMQIFTCIFHEDLLHCFVKYWLSSFCFGWTPKITTTSRIFPTLFRLLFSLCRLVYGFCNIKLLNFWRKEKKHSTKKTFFLTEQKRLFVYLLYIHCRKKLCSRRINHLIKHLNKQLTHNHFLPTNE